MKQQLIKTKFFSNFSIQRDFLKMLLTH